VVFFYASDRTAARPAGHLASFRGILQVDGYAGFEALEAKGLVALAACWVHMRRNFYKLQEKGSPLAGEAVRRIATLYRIEAEIRGKPPDIRQRVRAERSRPVVEAFRAWLDLQLPRLSGGSKLAEAIRYALNRWDALIRFLDDGRIDLDTNPIERAIRPVALGKKTRFLLEAMGARTAGQSWHL
jgi:hypothetical protein